MKLVKSLLLGSAAGLVAVAGASAADLGVKKPTAVEYVKTCPTYGAGFFVVPGTTSCLKIIGRVRVDYIFNDPRARVSDKNTFRARGYIGYDHRTATEYGLLRTYVRAFIGRDNAGGYAPVLEYAFIQFGGLTVGRVTPVFETGYAASTSMSYGFGGGSDIAYVNSIGYTANFGGGFSATIALDSAAERRVAAGGYAGQAMPDVVAALSYAGSWGEVKLSGAVHQVNPLNPTVDTKYGFAGQLGAKINLPMLSKGSYLWAQGTYASGAITYAGFANTFTIGNVTYTNPDATIVAGSLKMTTAYALAGGIKAYVTPTVWVGLAGQYSQVDPAGAANTTRTAAVITNVAWEPVAGFAIIGEGIYATATGRAGVVKAGAPRDRDSFLGRIRFQRDF